MGTGCTGRSPLAQGCVCTECLPSPTPQRSYQKPSPFSGALTAPGTWLAELTKKTLSF